MSLTRRSLLGTALGGAAAMSLGIRPGFAQAAPIKIGILHSLSGTMAISETTLKDVMLMLIE
ncbi:MAG: transporter substrate-binding protein, partial [Gemmobacter sp.]